MVSWGDHTCSLSPEGWPRVPADPCPAAPSPASPFEAPAATVSGGVRAAGVVSPLTDTDYAVIREYRRIMRAMQRERSQAFDGGQGGSVRFCTSAQVEDFCREQACQVYRQHGLTCGDALCLHCHSTDTHFLREGTALRAISQVSNGYPRSPLPMRSGCDAMTPEGQGPFSPSIERHPAGGRAGAHPQLVSLGRRHEGEENSIA